MWGQRGFIGYNYRPGPVAVGGRIPSQTTAERLPSPRISAQEGILKKTSAIKRNDLLSVTGG